MKPFSPTELEKPRPTIELTSPFEVASSLPKGFARVRYYGWLSSASKTKCERILALLDWKAPLTAQLPEPAKPKCDKCGTPLRWVATLERAPPTFR